MGTVLNHKNLAVNNNVDYTASNSIFNTFIKWCEGLESYRYAILSILVIVQGCIIIPPLLILSQYYNIGLNDITVIAAVSTTMAVLVTNMALAPMKIIVSTFALNLIINLSLIIVYLGAMIGQ